jgi:hypothetical protein
MNSKDRLYLFAAMVWLVAILLTASAAESFGANEVTIAAGSGIGAIQLTMDEAQAGETITFAPGTYSLAASIDVPNGVTVQGTSYTNTHLVFALPASAYAFVLPANGSNIAIKSLDVISNNGFVDMGSGNGFSNISIIGNSVKVGGTPTSTYFAGIYDTVPCNNFTIEFNYFHDSSSSTGLRMFYLWSPTNSNVTNNLFFNVWDCGQVAASSPATDVFNYSFNYGTSIVNKGLEMQSQYGGELGKANVTNNVFYDWLNPNEETYGLSVVPNQSNGSIAKGNYIAATSAPGSAPVNGHWGYGIEFGSANSVASYNTIIGPWGNSGGESDFGYSAANTQFYNNKLYGVANGTSPFGYEPGPNPSVVIGSGSLANTIDPNVNDAPAAPANTFAGPQFMQAATGSQPTSTQSAVPASSGSAQAAAAGSIQPSFDLTVTPVVADTTDGTASISWSGLPAAATAVKINTIATVGRQTGATVAPTAVIYPASPPTVTMDQCHTGWQIDFDADAIDANGNVLASSNVVTVQFPGNSSVSPPYATTAPTPTAEPTLTLPTTMPITLEGTLTINAQGQPALTLHN